METIMNPLTFEDLVNGRPIIFMENKKLMTTDGRFIV